MTRDGPVGVIPDELRVVPMFADLDRDDLAWVAEHSEEVVLEPGEMLFAVGEPADWMYMVLEGTVQARREQFGAEGPIFTARAGDIAGTVPFSRMTHFTGAGRAITRARVARFPKSLFAEMLRRIPKLEHRMVEHLTDRVREATRREEQYERLAALGKLAAGLAHELNNPATALRRSAAEMRAKLDALGRLAVDLAAAGVGAEGWCALDDARRAALASPAGAMLDPIAQSEREETIADWLEATGVDEPWVSAATFVAGGFDVPGLEAATANVPRSARATALSWLEAGVAADALARGMEEAAGRISKLVGEVRSYTHMDRAREKEEIDVHTGIESTLAIFAHQLRDKQITLVRDFARDLPRLRAYPGALNQVWTNLLDNAIDAAPAHGRVVIRTALEDTAVVVEVGDNGPGIPPDLLDRIWEPFFTTKDVGSGSGLGLDITRRIVVREHGGQISVSSVPGDTRFTVRLPIAGTMG